MANMGTDALLANWAIDFRLREASQCLESRDVAE